MIDSPKILQTEKQLTAAIRLTIPRNEMQHVMGPGIGELMATVAVQGKTPAGPWFTRHFRMTPEQFDIEICVPIGEPIVPTGRVVNSFLPASKVARTIYHGPFEGLGSAWGEFGEWIENEGHMPEEWLWETYLTDPSVNPDPSSWQTELTRPLVK